MEDRGKTWLVQLLDELGRQSFYGKLVISFQGGRIIQVKREETLKPPS